MEKLCKGTYITGGRSVEFLSLYKDSYFVSRNINFNAETDVPHGERDLVYTLIGVPNQDKEVSLKCQF
eukprot:207774-Ditylum_brightwellii.AAC.1